MFWDMSCGPGVCDVSGGDMVRESTEAGVNVRSNDEAGVIVLPIGK